MTKPSRAAAAADDAWIWPAAREASIIPEDRPGWCNPEGPVADTPYAACPQVVGRPFQGRQSLLQALNGVPLFTAFFPASSTTSSQAFFRPPAVRSIHECAFRAFPVV